MPAPTAPLSAKAKNLRDPHLPADPANNPETPEDLRTVEQVDWQALIVEALGPNTTLDKPLPQLLLRLGAVISDLTGNAEHLRYFVGGNSRDQVDLKDTVVEKLTKYSKLISKQSDQIAQLTRDVEHLKTARDQGDHHLPDRLATVQASNTSR